MNRLDQIACQFLAGAALEQDAVGLFGAATFPGHSSNKLDQDATYVDVVVSVAPGASRQAAIGSGEIRSRGSLIIQLRVPKDDAIAPTLRKVDAIASYLFSRRTGARWFALTDSNERDALATALDIGAGDLKATLDNILFEAPTAVRSGAVRTHRLITVTMPWQSWRSAAAA